MVGGGQRDDGKLEIKNNSSNMISLNWTDADSSLTDLRDVWDNSNKLLTYDLQVKVKVTTDDVVTGHSFRLTTGGDSDIANDSSYGYSFIDAEDGQESNDDSYKSRHHTIQY